MGCDCRGAGDGMAMDACPARCPIPGRYEHAAVTSESRHLPKNIYGCLRSCNAMISCPERGSAAARKRRSRTLAVSLLVVVLFLPCTALAADNGFISVISTPPGARVFVDDTYLAVTPCKGIFPAGQHTLRLTYPGYQDHEVPFVLHPLQSLGFEVTMTPLPPPATGTIGVTSVPSGARVFIDDTMVGITPYSGTYPTGGHTVKVTKTDYHDFGTTVMVEGGKTAAVTANLAPILPETGTVSVYSTPAGAFVAIDGTSYGTAPVTQAFAPGQHSLKVSAAGYNDYVATVSVTAGQSLPVYVTLVAGVPAAAPATPAIVAPVATVTSTTTIQPAATPLPSGAGSLLLSSRPEGANVYVDGTFIGKSPAGMRSVAAGPHTVLFTMNGFADFSSIVRVTSGETTEFLATMEPAGQRAGAGTQATRAPGPGLLPAIAGIAGYVLLKRRMGE